MPTATPTRVEPQRWVHRPNVVEAMRHDGTEEGGRALVAWVRSRGGEAEPTLDGPLVKTQVKWVRVPVGFWVGHGVVGQFWVISAEVHALSYDPADGGYGADLSLDEDSLRLLRTEAHETTDVERLREIVDVAVAAAVA